MPDLPLPTPPPPASKQAGTAAPPPAGLPAAPGGAFADLIPQQPQGGTAPAPTGATAAPPPLSPDNPFGDLIPSAQAAAPRSKSAAWSDQIGDFASFGAMPKISGAISGAEAAGKYMLAGMRDPAVGAKQSFSGLGDAYNSAYETERNRINDQFAADREQHPLPFLARLGAGLLNPVSEFLPGGAGAKTALGAVGKTALGGGIAGGVQAAAQTVGGPWDYAKNIGTGVAAGSVLSALLGAAGQGAGKGLAQLTKYATPFYQKAFAQPDITTPEVVQQWSDIADKAGVPLPRQPVETDPSKILLSPQSATTIPQSELDAAAKAVDARFGLGPTTEPPKSISVAQIDQIKKAADAAAKNLQRSSDGAQRNAGNTLRNAINAALAATDKERPLYQIARAAGGEGVGDMRGLLKAAMQAQGGSIGGLASVADELGGMPASQRGLAATRTLAPATGQLSSAALMQILQNASRAPYGP